jgi:hypothetical protein
MGSPPHAVEYHSRKLVWSSVAYRDCLVDLVCLVFLVHLVRLVFLVYLVCLVSLVYLVARASRTEAPNGSYHRFHVRFSPSNFGFSTSQDVDADAERPAR